MSLEAKGSKTPVPGISIVIPAQNEAKNIGVCLERILGQDIQVSMDVTVIDSGSTDGTRDIVRSCPASVVRWIPIPASAFGHGRTRNLGVKKSRGPWIVFLNADALPADRKWLQMLFRTATENRDTGAVFSRHLPRSDCHLYMVRDLLHAFPPGKTDSIEGRRKHPRFSTVSCMVRRALLEAHPFRDEIITAEDREWARRVVSSDQWKIRYEPRSRVIHSHNYTPRQLFSIKRKTGASVPLFSTFLSTMLAGVPLALGGMAAKWVGDFLFILFKRHREGVSIPGELGKALSARIWGFAGTLAGWLDAFRGAKR